MKKYYLAIIILIVIIACNKKLEPSTSIHAIPFNSDLIIQCHDMTNIHDKITKFPWWKELINTNNFQEKITILNKLNNQYNLFDLFKNRTIFISSVLKKKQTNEIIFITKINKTNETEKILVDSIINKLKNKDTIIKKSYENAIIYHLKELNTFICIHKDVLLLSFSSITIEKSIRQINNKVNIFETEIIKKLETSSPKYSNINMLVKTDLLEKIIGQKNIFLNSETWSSFDVKLTKNHITINGLTNRGNIKYLRNTKYSNATKSHIENILPRHVKGFYKYQINNNTDLNEVVNIITDGPNKNNYHLSYKTWQPIEINTVYNTTSFSNLSYLIFKPNNNQECLKSLKEMHVDNNISTEYLNYTIQEITLSKKDPNWISSIIKKWNKTYYVIFDDYILLAQSKKNIKSLLNNSISKQTIGQSNALEIINTEIGNKSHTSFYLTFENHQQEWKKIFNSVASKNIGSEKYFFNSLIFLYQNSFVKNTTNWSSNLKNETNYKPQIVQNHYNKEFEIITQDIENTIYLLDKDGNKLWDKEIGNSIMGDIHQIDSYKNNKLQYLFNTKDSIYLIDRNGQHVSPFPIATQDPISMPLAVFDYDNTKKYRILIVMQNKLIMYSQRGKIVSGWEFLSTKSNIAFTPEHYQVFNKDYIIISEENGKTHLLNRRGQARVNVKDKIYRSNQKTSLIEANSLNNSKLLIKDNSNKMLELYLNGEIDTLYNSAYNVYIQKNYIKQPEKNYTLTIRSKELRFISSDNKFKYKFNTSSLSEPVVFNYNDSLFIAIKNNSENLIYLFNEDGDLHQKPMFGTTDFSIMQSDKKNQKNIIVGSQEGLIYNYKIN